MKQYLLLKHHFLSYTIAPQQLNASWGDFPGKSPPTKRNILDREGWVRYKRVYPIHFRENRIINQYNNIYICIYNDNNILFFWYFLLIITVSRFLFSINGSSCSSHWPQIWDDLRGFVPKKISGWGHMDSGNNI